jgi:hypothetical protein
MTKQKITLNNVHYQWEKILSKITDNDNIILFVYKGNKHKEHFMILHQLTWLNDVNSYNIQPYYSHQGFLEAYRNNKDYTVVLISHYIEENLSQEYISIEKENLMKYHDVSFKNLNKKIISIKYHSKLIGNNKLINEIDSINADFIRKIQ